MAIAKQDVPHTIRFVTGRSPPPIATVDVQKFLPIPIESEVAMAEEDIPGNGTLQGRLCVQPHSRHMQSAICDVQWRAETESPLKIAALNTGIRRGMGIDDRLTAGPGPFTFLLLLLCDGDSVSANLHAF